MIVRYLAASIPVASLLLLATAAIAQDEAHELGADGQRFVSIGQLASQASPTGKGSHYVLLDELGDVTATVKSAAGVDLEKYLGHEVGVTARTLVDGAIPVLLAQSVTSFGRAETLHEDGTVTGAGYLQEELPAAVAVPDDFGAIDDESAIRGPFLSDGFTQGVPCDACGTVGCGRSCGLPGTFWIRSEYLIWWTEGMRTPPLLTTSPAGTLAGDAGVLGTPGVGVLYGGEEILADSRSGARFRMGTWRDNEGRNGFETDFFFLANEDQNYAAATIGPQIIARPFLNTDEGQDSQLIQFPGVVNGTVHIEADTSLWSIAPRLRLNLACERMLDCDPYYPGAAGGYRMDLLLGYRYMRLDDRLVINESVATVDVNDPTYFLLNDSFDSSNDFHGADLGLLWEGYRGPWSLELIGRVGLGNTRQNVTISGATTTTGMGSTFNDPGGLLALSSNMGSYSRDKFTVIPEVSATLGYAMSPRTRFLVGYTFIYWNHVVRAGEIIDTTVNQAFIPNQAGTNGPDRPEFRFADAGFWVQGLSLGLEYRW